MDSKFAFTILQFSITVTPEEVIVDSLIDKLKEYKESNFSTEKEPYIDTFKLLLKLRQKTKNMDVFDILKDMESLADIEQFVENKESINNIIKDK